MIIQAASTLLALAGVTMALTAQAPTSAPRFAKRQLTKQFDADANGRLTGDERRAAIAWLEADREKSPPRRRPAGAEVRARVLRGRQGQRRALGQGSERTPGLEKFFRERRAFLDGCASLED